MSNPYSQGAVLSAQSGNINPASIIAIDTANPYGAIHCPSAGQPIGVSLPSTKYPPGLGIGGANSGVLAEHTTAAGTIVNDPVPYLGNGALAYLQAGTGGWTAGAFIKADTAGTGTGIVATTTGDKCVGIALDAASAGEWHQILVQIFTHA